MTIKSHAETIGTVDAGNQAQGLDQSPAAVDQSAETESETEAHRRPFQMFGGFSAFGPL